MYGLTDNIVAGPAGHIEAAPAGHFEAGPAGSTPVGPVGSSIVGPAGHTTPGPAGHTTPGPGGGTYPGPAGGGFVGGGSHVPVEPSGHFTPEPGGHFTVQPGASFSPTSGVTQQAFPVAGGASFPGLGGGGGTATGGGTGVSYMALAGPGMPPVEVHGGQPTAQPSPGFTVSFPGRVVGGRTGHVVPPQAAHFHGHATPNVSHSPVRVENYNHTQEYWHDEHLPSLYSPAKVTFDLWSLPSSHAHVDTYEPPHVIFPEEHPGALSTTVDTTVGAARMQVTEVLNNTTSLDLGQTRNVQYASTTRDESSVTLSSPQTHNATINEPQTLESNVNIDQTRNVTQVFLAGGLSPAALNMGRPLMANVA
jgi:hypothetical protein